MIVHIMFKGGPYDGQLYSLPLKWPQDQVRIAHKDAIKADTQEVSVDLYQVIESSKFMPTHIQAAYRWVGSKLSNTHLVDLWVE